MCVCCSAGIAGSEGLSTCGWLTFVCSNVCGMVHLWWWVLVKSSDLGVCGWPEHSTHLRLSAVTHPHTCCFLLIYCHVMPWSNGPEPYSQTRLSGCRTPMTRTGKKPSNNHSEHPSNHIATLYWASAVNRKHMLKCMFFSCLWGFEVSNSRCVGGVWSSKNEDCFVSCSYS